MGKVILISGGSDGLGYAIAKQLSSSNKVVICSPTKEKLEKAAEELSCEFEVCDVSDKSSPSLARNVSIDGSYYDSRMIGDYVYVIANQPMYNYGGGPVPLPVIYSGGAAKEISATDIYYFGMPDNSFIFTNIISLNTQNSEEPSSKTFLMGYSQNTYVSQNNIYMVYQKRVSEFKIYDRVIDEIILPLVSSDFKNKISEIRNSNSNS